MILQNIQDPRLRTRKRGLNLHGYPKQAEAVQVVASVVGEKKAYEYIRDIYTIEELDAFLAEFRKALELVRTASVELARPFRVFARDQQAIGAN